ncbi:MAG: hypothetical protein KGL39_57460, partial [Patescibacteria group bacterium]|nr:hypothetical protein [Patescibacteria group bacterium]
MSNSFDPGPFDISQWSMGFRTTVVKADTAAINGAESFIESLRNAVIAGATTAIDPSEGIAKHLAEIMAGMLTGGLRDIEHGADRHLQSLEDAVRIDLSTVLIPLEEWMGTVPGYVWDRINGNTAPNDWLNPFEGMPGEENTAEGPGGPGGGGTVPIGGPGGGGTVPIGGPGGGGTVP